MSWRLSTVNSSTKSGSRPEAGARSWDGFDLRIPRDHAGDVPARWVEGSREDVECQALRTARPRSRAR
jgi:hypothetical protein